MRVAAAALVLGMVLAGCSDEPGPNDQPTVFQGLGEDVPVTATTGSVAGVVVDDAIRPLRGANVTLVNTDHVAQSDDEGRFAFESLEPGTYFLSAQAHRYETAQVSVDVVAGDVATVRVLLAASTSVEPFHLTLSYHGHIDNYLGEPNFLLELLAPGTLPCQCKFTYTPEANLSTMVVEAVGTTAIPNPGTPATDDGDVYTEVLLEGSLISSGYDDFPVYRRFNDDPRESASESYMVRLTGGVLPTGTIDYDLYVSLWYHEDAPDGWSFVAENS